MSKEKKSILPQGTQAQARDSMFPSIYGWTPALHSLTFTHPIQIENLLPVPISVRFKMPALRLLSRFLSKNIVYGEYMKDIKALINSEINMYNSKEVVIPELGEGCIEDVHPFNGLLLSLFIDEYERSECHEIMDQAFRDSLRNYLKLTRKNGDVSSILHPQNAVSDEYLHQFSKPYVFNKIFQFFSESQNEQLNVCLETVFYKGSLKLTFFSQYWFLNEASFPLMIRFTEGSYTYDPISLDSSNIKLKSIETSEDPKDPQLPSIHWLPDEETKVNSDSLQHRFEVQPKGLKSIRNAKEIEEKLIPSNNLDNSFFSLKSSQLSKTYVDSLLKTKSKYIKLVTTNLADNTETTMDASVEEVTEWSNQLLISNFSGAQPCFEMSEKTGYRDRTKEKDKSMVEQDKNAPTKLFELCLNVVQLPGKLNRTKLVLVAPKYIVVNSTKFSLLIGQIPDNKYAFGQLPPQAATPFHWNFKDKPRSLHIRIEKKNYLWSPAFSLQKPTSFSFRMRSLDEQEIQICSVNVSYIRLHLS